MCKIKVQPLVLESRLLTSIDSKPNKPIKTPWEIDEPYK